MSGYVVPCMLCLQQGLGFKSQNNKGVKDPKRKEERKQDRKEGNNFGRGRNVT